MLRLLDLLEINVGHLFVTGLLAAGLVSCGSLLRAGLLACSLCVLLLAAGFAVLLTGCAKPGPEKPYTVRLIRPDGVVHATRTVSSSEPPWIRSTGSGRAWVADSGLYAPHGWLIEVEPLAEAQ